VLSNIETANQKRLDEYPDTMVQQVLSIITKTSCMKISFIKTLRHSFLINSCE